MVSWLYDFSFLTVSKTLVHIDHFLMIFLFMQDLLQKSNATDASGNVILSDFGVHMQQKVCSS